jgi:uncharacterized protein YbaP (TraB family)
MIDKIPGMKQALEECDIVVGEIDNEALMGQDYQMAMAEFMFAPSDSTLDKLLTNEEYALVEQEYNKYFGDLGMKLQQYNNFKPNAVNALITAMRMMEDAPTFQDFQELKDIIDLQGLSAANGSGMDRAVQKRAKEMGRQSVALETIEEQLMLFNIPIAKQVKGLLDACNNPDLTKVQFTQFMTILKAYMAQDLSEVYSIMTDPEIVDAGAIGMLRVNERNLNWIEKLVKMIPEHSCLVYVGAAHLPGELGVLQLLRDRGYTVEPMQ